MWRDGLFLNVALPPSPLPPNSGGGLTQALNPPSPNSGGGLTQALNPPSPNSGRAREGSKSTLSENDAPNSPLSRGEIQKNLTFGLLLVLAILLAACNPFAGEDAAEEWFFQTTVVPEERGDFPVIVVIGDSLAAGWGDCDSVPCSGIERHWWAEAIGNQGYVFNRGLGRTDTEDLLLHWDALTADADILFIMIGVNDVGAGASPEAILTALREMRERALAADIIPIFSTMMPAQSTQPGAQLSAMQTVNAELRGLAEAGWWVIDFSAHMQDPDNLGYLPPEWMAAPISAHPNALGYDRMRDFLRAWWEANAGGLFAP